MAKHPHRLLLNQKKTWRCTLPNCSYFIHVGLAHILPGKQSICWECSEEFTLSEEALKDDQPVCDRCRSKNEGWDMDAMSKYTAARLALGKAGVKSVSELNPVRRRMIEAAEGVDFSVLESVEDLKDEVEVIEEDETHALSCSIYETGRCSCK